MLASWDATVAAAGDALAAAVVVLAALLLARTLLVAALGVLGRAPGALGRRAGAWVSVLRPGIARRLVAGLLGLGTPALAVLTTAPPATASALPSAPASTASASTASTRAAHTSGAGTSYSPDLAPRHAVAPQPPTRLVVVVRPGDTLWDIARRHLPDSATSSDVARVWPRWYAANRAAIGPDPALLRPGTRLRSPDRRPAGTPASTHDRPPATHTDPGAVARSLDPDRR